MMTLATPMVDVLVAQTAIGIAETFYVGLLGTETLAGATLVFPLVMLMTMMANGGIGAGVSPPPPRGLPELAGTRTPTPSTGVVAQTKHGVAPNEVDASASRLYTKLDEGDQRGQV